MSQVLITGATGLVGGHLLRMLINEPKVNAIAAPTRRPLGDMPGVFNPHDPQLSDALAQVTDPIDIVFCCLGTTRREAGSKEAFIHADYTLVVDTALTGRRLCSARMKIGRSRSSWNILVWGSRVRAVTRQSMVRTSSPA